MQEAAGRYRDFGDSTLAVEALKVADRLLEPFLQLHRRLPSQLLSGLRDVGLPDLGVVDGERLEHDLALRVREPLDRLRELQHGQLGRVADVDGVVHVGEQETVDPVDEVRDVAEGRGSASRRRRR